MEKKVKLGKVIAVVRRESEKEEANYNFGSYSW